MPPLRGQPGDLPGALDAYERDFEWFCFCLACGHVPAGSYLGLQQLYLAHAAAAADSHELYPLVEAHWEAVNAAYDMAAARHPGQRRPAQKRLRAAQARHRAAARALRQAWRR